MKASEQALRALLSGDTAALNRAYEAASLKAVLADVRRHNPDVNPRDAGITRGSAYQSYYCFEFKGFRWYGNAESVTEARAAGWSAWLKKEGVPEYASN